RLIAQRVSNVDGCLHTAIYITRYCSMSVPRFGLVREPGGRRRGVFDPPVGGRLGHLLGGRDDLAPLPARARPGQALQEGNPGPSLPVLAEKRIVLPMQVVAQPGSAPDTADQTPAFIRVG